MSRPRRPLPCLLLAAVAALAGPAARAEAEPASSALDAATFRRAEREGRLVLLTVSAAWCHWCHVMERETYPDPRVVARLDARFLRVVVDADARPDLAERYAEYHWPATVFLAPDGRVIHALRGYRSADDFLTVLAEVDAAARAGRSLVDPTPPGARGSAPRGDAFLPALRARLVARLDATWDPVEGGWGFGQKYPYPASVLHALLATRLGADGRARTRALRTLEQTTRLLDPVWGGLYQYSEGGVWDRPHYEKIASVNAGALEAFASAYRLTRDERWRRAAYDVRRFWTERLRDPSGAFGTSQDADVGSHGDAPFTEGRLYFARDDAGRRRLGLPRVDRTIYAMENGAFVHALCALHLATGDPEPLRDAERAARAVLATHRDPAGGLRHGAADRDGIHLGDQAVFGRACVSLAEATADPAWLDEAVRIADAMLARLLDVERGGFRVRTQDAAVAPAFGDPPRPFEGNAAAARFLLALHAATGRTRLRDEALRAIAAVSDDDLVARFGWRCSALLLAVEEASAPWTLATLVAGDDDSAAVPFLEAVRALDAPLLLRVRVAPGEVSPTGTTFPPTPAPALYLCGDGRCSPPVRRPADLPGAWRTFVAR